jgi:type II secretory pathway pseudopilin PulG
MKRTLTTAGSVVFVALAVGFLAGYATSTSVNNSNKNQRNQIISEAEDEAQELIDDARTKIDDYEIDAMNAKKDAKQAERELQKLRADIRGIEANNFSGDGTYLVGTDIKPGIYKADPSVGCYWARLDSLDTSDIINNNNVDGPVVVEILSGDTAFMVSGCGDFRKVS